jgi:cobalt/nickel transport system ATP-binding protein
VSHHHLTAHDLVHRYRHRDIEALQRCSIDIAPGSRVAIVGANGSGKTTLLLHLNGSLRPQSGTVALDGEVQRYDKKSLAAWRREVGLVVQDPDDMLLAGTVWQEVGFGPLNMGSSHDDAQRQVAAVLDELSLSELASRPTHLLSGGERHRVAIAAVAVTRPCVLLLDEPTAGLDPASASEVLDVLDRLHVGGTSIVMSTHDIDLAYGWADHVIIMGSGCTLVSGSRDVLHDDVVVASARLSVPTVVTMWRALPASLRPGQCPATVDGLVRSLEVNGTGSAREV